MTGRRPPLATVGLAAALVATGCASSTGGRSQVADPGAAARARMAPAATRPYRVTYEWSYADERGPLEGEGVMRYNPPDSLRLDLFGPGDGSMAVALTESGLSSLGQIQDVRLPPPAFLYATAGIFRPGPDGPADGYRTADGTVLVYRVENGRRRFRFRGGRLRGVVEERRGRTTRRLEVRWAEAVEPLWPDGAVYRDLEEGRRARWRRLDARPEETRFPSDIYALTDTP